MSITTTSTSWQTIGSSVCGASHERSGKPNQDAIDWHPDSEDGKSVCLAVSDGHGSTKSFRSHIGAQFAVKSAVSVIEQFLEVQQNGPGNSTIKRTAEEGLPQALVNAWQCAVRDHLTWNPFSESDWAIASQGDRNAVRTAVEKNPLLAYGATLLSVLISPSFILYLQLGDGDILCVSDSGDVSRPMQRDERLFANETTSLCLDNAWRDFRVVFQPIEAEPPSLILAATDGYANSFRTEPDFLKVGGDILDMIRADGIDSVRESLEPWLAEASEAGSGDDITLGIICRTESGTGQ